EKWTSEVKRVQGKLSNERFVSNAPEEVVEAERAKEKDYLEKHCQSQFDQSGSCH
ncbi:hypothetical protein, partial [Enterococcus faecium]|uniref:hypothetical protein n=1 Tax=Enterococcus faecium TaxID=1352 RepID=UPI00292D78ED